MSIDSRISIAGLTLQVLSYDGIKYSYIFYTVVDMFEDAIQQYLEPTLGYSTKIITLALTSKIEL